MSHAGKVSKFIFDRCVGNSTITNMVGVHPNEKVYQVYEDSPPPGAVLPYLIFTPEVVNINHRQDGSMTHRVATYLIKLIGHGNEHSWADDCLDTLIQLFTIKQGFEDNVTVGAHVSSDLHYVTHEDGKYYSHVGILVEIKSHAREN